MSRVGEKIKKARLESNMTQKQLAKKLGVAESYVNEIETGRKIANESLITRISKALNREINDIGMSVEEETFRESAKEVKTEVKRVYSTEASPKKPVEEVWNQAFGDVLKNVPVMDYSLQKSITYRQLAVHGNKIEGYALDKVFFLEIQDDDMAGFRISKGDIAFCHSIKEVENNAICLLEYNGERFIRQVKKLDSTKALLIYNKGTLKTETVNVKDIRVIAKLDKVEIKL